MQTCVTRLCQLLAVWLLNLSELSFLLCPFGLTASTTSLAFE